MPDKNKFKHLKKRFDEYHSSTVKTLKKKHKRALVVAKTNALALAGSALLASSAGATHFSASMHDKQHINTLISANDSEEKKSKEAKENLELLNKALLNNPNNLTADEELKAEKALSDFYKLNLKVTLDGNRMNRVWGYFGQEQHLYRWQGDTLSAHGEELEHGIAPAKGAFGYFDNAEQEKYYIAAPIHLLPDWNSNWSTLKPWYKFRKVFVYNPKNERGIIAVIGDAGPAEWTGKHFGGSPELMAYLDMYDGSAKSKAIVLFVDESQGNVALGPVDVKADHSIAALSEP